MVRQIEGQTYLFNGTSDAFHSLLVSDNFFKYDFTFYSRLALEAAPKEDEEGKDKKNVLNELLESDVEISPEQALAAVL